MKRILVLGAGAVGCSIAGYLAREGRDVVVADTWFQQINELRANGLRVGSPDGEFQTELRAVHVDELHTIASPVDVGIIALKAYDAEWGYRLLRPYVADDGVVLAAQNGVVEELLPRYADMSGVLGCVVNLAAECFTPGYVNRTLTSGWPALKIGELAGGRSARADGVADLLGPVGDVTVSENIMGELWSKLALNAMTNATGAITGATTPIIWGDDRFVPVALAAAAEVVDVARRSGVEIAPVFGSMEPEALLELAEGRPGPAAALEATLREIAEGRRGARENKPSMLQDIQKGRRTEVDYISGYVAERGRQLGAATPVNARLAELVHEVEVGRRPVTFDNVDEVRAVIPPALLGA